MITDLFGLTDVLILKSGELRCEKWRTAKLRFYRFWNLLLYKAGKETWYPLATANLLRNYKLSLPNIVSSWATGSLQKVYRPFTRYRVVVPLSESIMNVCLQKEEIKENIIVALYGIIYLYICIQMEYKYRNLTSFRAFARVSSL